MLLAAPVSLTRTRVGGSTQPGLGAELRGSFPARSLRRISIHTRERVRVAVQSARLVRLLVAR
jgi:hypothetical protein